VLAHLAPARRRLVVGVIAGAALLLVAVAAVIGLSLTRVHDVTPVAQDQTPPVVLVPGYGGSTTGLSALAGALRSTGRTVRILDLGQDSRADLRTQATLLDRAVRSVLTESGAHAVDLVGYSAGGVTVRVWMRDHHGGDVARRIVTLGSPHHGTDLAGVAADLAPSSCPLACRQLAPDSALLRSLNAGDESPPGPLWVSIWTDRDRVVVPVTSASLQGSLAFAVQSVCPADQVSHQGLPSDPTVVAMTVAALGTTAPTTPQRSICVSP
jgi:triacylglycerol lipase